MEKLRIDIENENEKPLDIPADELGNILLSSEIVSTGKSYIPVKDFDEHFTDELSGIDYEFCHRFIVHRDIADGAKHSSPEFLNLKIWELKKIGRRILEKPCVQIYLQELQTELREKHNLTADNIKDKLNNLLIDAENDKDKDMRFKCIMGLAKVGGHLVNKNETTHFDKLEIRFTDDFDPRTYIPENTKLQEENDEE